MACSQFLTLCATTGSTADVTGTTYTLPPKSNQFLGRIKARSVNAATTIAGKIQHSPDGSVWFDACTFTSIAGASGDEVKVTTPTSLFLNVRAVFALTGATKAADVTIELWFDPKVL